MPKEAKKDIEKRILEAERVVVSDILHRWRKKYGMDYAIVVFNAPGDVFTRVRISEKSKGEMKAAFESAWEREVDAMMLHSALKQDKE
jgi:hypothetical protein